jgi:hypothetical protein
MMNGLLCGLVLALSCAAIDAVATEQSGPAATLADDAPATSLADGEAVAGVRPSASFQAGPVKITPGGFFELTSIYRTRNETGDIGSSFSGAPFPDNNNYKISEFRETIHNSRFSLLAQAPSDRGNQLEGYLETDFVSAGVTSNSNESNSYTLRVRQLFINWSRADLGWSVTAGQAWSLATMLKEGLAPRNEDIPLINDGQYVTGWVWTRQPQLRIVKTIIPSIALGVSLEGPQNVVKGETLAGTTAVNPGGAALNSSTNYSTDIAPDVVVKMAFDPGFGHYEVYSLTRFLHDRAPSVPGVLSSEGNHTTVAQSVGGGLILPIWPHWLDLHANTLIGHGNGRYGSAQLGDSTYNTTNGSMAALPQNQGMVGLVAHTTRTFDLYAYAGYEEQKPAFGLIPANNTACDAPYTNLGLLPTGAICGNVGTVRQVAGGFLWKFYEGRLGYVHGGPEIEYINDQTYTAHNGGIGRTNDTMIYLTVRYFPYQ